MPSNSLSGFSRPKHCHAMVFEGADRPLVLREIEVPAPLAGEALVRIKLCTICGSDLHTITGKRVEPTPSILAHEVIGTVVELGDPGPVDVGGNPLRPGDLVTWSVCVSCFECDRCRGGMPQKCRSIMKYGHALASGRAALSGGMADYILLRSGSSIAKLSSEIPEEAACPINCATATIAAGFRVAGEVAGARVLVIGAGMLGLTASAFARHAQAAAVTLCDPDESRRRRGAHFGVDESLDFDGLRASGRLFDVVLECSGAPEAVEAACELSDIGGRVVCVGSVMESRPVQLNPSRIVRNWLSIHGVHNYRPDDLLRAIDFVSQSHNDFPFASLVERTFPLEDANLAVASAIEERPVRLGIRPQQ